MKKGGGGQRVSKGTGWKRYFFTPTLFAVQNFGPVEVKEITTIVIGEGDRKEGNRERGRK